MPRYFFYLHNDMDVFDKEGAELPDDGAARAYAVENVREVAIEGVAQGYLDLDDYIDVVRDDGTAVHRVRFGDAITVAGRSEPSPLREAILRQGEHGQKGGPGGC